MFWFSFLNFGIATREIPSCCIVGNREFFIGLLWNVKFTCLTNPKENVWPFKLSGEVISLDNFCDFLEKWKYGNQSDNMVFKGEKDRLN